MSAAHVNLDLTPPPVVKTIGRRSLVIGLIFAAISLVLAFIRPDQFFRAYLLGYMCWLGVALGSMAILMIRHLTGGGWGLVIRRIMGAAMRTLPLLAVLFIPLLFGMPKLYVWARPLDTIADPHLREHLRDITKSYLNVPGFIIRAVIYLAIWNLLSFLLTKWSHEQDKPHNPRQHAALQSRKRARADSLRIHYFVCRHRLDNVHRSQLDFDHLRLADPDR